MSRVIFYYYSGSEGAPPLRLGGEGVDVKLAAEWDDLHWLLADPNAAPDFVILDSVPAKDKVEVVRRIKQIKNVPVIFFEEMPAAEKKKLVRERAPRSCAPGPAASPRTPKPAAEPENPVETARRYMDDNFQVALTLDDIAGQAGLSPSYFCRRFKDQYQQSPITYLRNLRLGRASHLLYNTHLPLADIAQQSGFLSVSYFCREFKKAFGTPPIASRRARRKKIAKSRSTTIKRTSKKKT